MPIDDHKTPPLSPMNFRAGIRITYLSLCLQIVFALSKAVIGYLGGSYALVADSFHSFSDMFSDFALIVGLHIASRPKDSSHHYGHGKIENYVAHIIGLMIIVLGCSIGYNAIAKMFTSTKPAIPNMITLIPAIICIVSQETLYRVTLKVGKRIKSRGVIANAWHHRSDAITSFLALAGIGIAMTIPQLYFMDIAMAGIIALIVISMGCKLFWQSLKDIIDTSPPKKIYKKIFNTAQNVEGVLNIHNIRARYYSSYIFLDAHIKVDPSISVKAGHDIAHDVVDELKLHIPDLVDVVIHIEPFSS